MADGKSSWSQSDEIGIKFRTTAWSEIRRATQRGDPASALEAWEHLCRAYWRPIYTHIRRWGNAPELAKDLTQDYFYHLLHQERLKSADRNRGKFRSFLLGSLNHFLRSEWHRRIARKRDERLVISLDQAEAEEGLRPEPVGGMSPDQLFERDWATHLLARVRERLVQELQSEGKETQLALLPIALHETATLSYREFAGKFQVSEDNVKKMVQRLREFWQAILREEVLATVENSSEVEEEIRYLLQVLDK